MHVIDLSLISAATIKETRSHAACCMHSKHLHLSRGAGYIAIAQRRKIIILLHTRSSLAIVRRVLVAAGSPGIAVADMGWRIMGCGRTNAVKGFQRRAGRGKENRASIHATLGDLPLCWGQRDAASYLGADTPAHIFETVSIGNNGHVVDSDVVASLRAGLK